MNTMAANDHHTAEAGIATASVPLVVKLADAPYRPPAFVLGAHDASAVLEGTCAPSYLEVILNSLGAYTVLGLPLDELAGHTVDLTDVLGPDGRRLGERLRATPSWRQRFGLLDRFLLARLRSGREVKVCSRPCRRLRLAWAANRLLLAPRGLAGAASP